MKMRAGIALAALFLVIALSQKVSAQECVSQDQLTKEDKYIGKLQGKCVKSIHRKRDFNMAILHDGTIAVYGTSRNLSQTLTATEAKSKTLDAETLEIKTQTDQTESGAERDEYHIWSEFVYLWGSLPTNLLTNQALQRADELVDEYAQLPPQNRTDSTTPYLFCLRGNRYKNVLEPILLTPAQRMNCLDGYIISDLARTEDTPSLDERKEAIQKLKAELLSYAEKNMLILSKKIIEYLDPQSFQELEAAGKF